MINIEKRMLWIVFALFCILMFLIYVNHIENMEKVKYISLVNTYVGEILDNDGCNAVKCDETISYMDELREMVKNWNKR